MLDAMSMAYELERPPFHTVTPEKVFHRGLFND
jgi:pyrroloquinoline-quinone synthase